MTHIRTTRALLSRHRITPRTHNFSRHQQRRAFAAEPPSPHPPSTPPNPNLPKEPSRVGAYYGTFGSPILKCFLGALFTYQIAYYGWLKLETLEETHDHKAQIAGLQEELRAAIETRKEKLGEVVEEVKEKVEGVGKGGEVVGTVAKGGWWPW